MERAASQLKQKKLFLFDIDGTIAMDQKLFDGTKELLEYICSIGGKAIYITNNSTKSREDYIKKFAKWNIKTEQSDFITASYATCLYLDKHHRHDKIYVVGTNSFVKELSSWGFDVTTKLQGRIQVVLVGFDNELTYQKLEDACLLLTDPNIVYLATNPDLCCPTTFGSVPDCGAICTMLSCAVKRMPQFLGKPNPIIADISMKQTGFSKEQTIVVGDRLYTDIAVGINAGVDTAVVFTGEAKKEDCEQTEYAPTWQFDTIRQLLDTICGK
ncbi:MAG: HAD-IIA family hydrolase [Clostridiales bacterium]|nr:HAD-IIA family hydrolase [Clostridiales bacterium]